MTPAALTPRAFTLSGCTDNEQDLQEEIGRSIGCVAGLEGRWPGEILATAWILSSDWNRALPLGSPCEAKTVRGISILAFTGHSIQLRVDLTQNRHSGRKKNRETGRDSKYSSSRSGRLRSSTGVGGLLRGPGLSRGSLAEKYFPDT